MLAPELQFVVHSSEVVDEEGYAHRGSRLTTLEDDAGSRGPPNTPAWRSRDFAFAAYRNCQARGLKQVHLGKWNFWAFASARQHCEEIVVFRKGADTRKKWNDDSLTDNTSGQGMFFIMRAVQINSETPLNVQFNGEWGFWESFFVPLLDEEHTMRSLTLMDPAMVEDHFSLERLPVACHQPPSQGGSVGAGVLAVSADASVTYEVKIVCKEMSEWSDLLNKIGDDMRMEDYCIVEHKHLKPGDECIDAYHEQTGIEDHARLLKRDFEQLKLPVVLTFRNTLKIKDWQQDMISLKYKYDFLNQVYTSNLMGGFTSMSGAKADPWHPVARLAVSALSKILARFPEIQTVLDVGCGDLSWMQYFLQEHPNLAYVGADINPYCLALNFKRFPRMHFVQTDLSNISGVEVLPRCCDLVIAKDVFNHMTLPDAINAVKRTVNTRPRFLLTHVHGACDNSGWERRIDKHLHYTRYDYNKPPFSLPFPATMVQQISEEAYFILYEICPEAMLDPPVRSAALRLPMAPSSTAASGTAKAAVGGFDLLQANEYEDPPSYPSLLEPQAPTKAGASASKAAVSTKSSVTPPSAVNTETSAGGSPHFAPGERTSLAPSPLTQLPDPTAEEAKPVAERKPIKGLSPVEFRARCDIIFDKFDTKRTGALQFAEVAAIMELGGRKVETAAAYESLCKRMDCDASKGLSRKDLQLFFERAPENLWTQVYRSVDPLAGCICRGASQLPETTLEKPIAEFLFEDGDQFAAVHIELNAHMFYGAAEAITEERFQAYFSSQRLELHLVAPAAFGGQDLYRWKLVVSPLSGDIIPEDSTVELKETTGRFGSKRVSVNLMKGKKKKWYKVGQIAQGYRS
mmetsp:Transcript_22815/g.48475  ORF Transcript_22815/g.48475 Transcript_22815/m.48475 type:complete len:857 (+) Transcript_22815:63-2633(+)